MDDADYAVFLNLLKRYLSAQPTKDAKGREYTSLHDELELLSFCLMPNHYHLLLYLHNPDAVTKLIRGVASSYTVYFNKRHGRVGHLFQERFKASKIDNDAYLTHISRYIHLNPVSYKTWEYTSLPYYLGEKHASWIQPGKIMELFKDTAEYAAFVDNYVENEEMFDEIKSELADY
jgi:putative transposase